MTGRVCQIFIILLIERVSLPIRPPVVLLFCFYALSLWPFRGPASDPGPNSGDLAEKYDSNDGRLLCRRILSKYLPYDPHNYQLDGICPVLDGFDLPQERRAI